MLPSSLSRSSAYSKLPLEAKVLYPLLVANADDQGRLTADPVGIKWEICPNVSEISADEIPDILLALEEQGLATVYDDDGRPALQILSWWTDQASLSWAYPSDYCPPPGWDDHLRFRKQGKVITINWPGIHDGSKGGKPLPAATEWMMPARSLAIALAKATGKGIGKPLPIEPGPDNNETPDLQADSLANALPNALPQAITQHKPNQDKDNTTSPPLTGGQGGDLEQTVKEPDDRQVVNEL